MNDQHACFSSFFSGVMSRACDVHAVAALYMELIESKSLLLLPSSRALPFVRPHERTSRERGGSLSVCVAAPVRMDKISPHFFGP